MTERGLGQKELRFQVESVPTADQTATFLSETEQGLYCWSQLQI